MSVNTPKSSYEIDCFSSIINNFINEKAIAFETDVEGKNLSNYENGIIIFNDGIGYCLTFGANDEIPQEIIEEVNSVFSTGIAKKMPFWNKFQALLKNKGFEPYTLSDEEKARINKEVEEIKNIPDKMPENTGESKTDKTSEDTRDMVGKIFSPPEK